MLPADSYDSTETRLRTQHPKDRSVGKRPFQESSGSLYRKFILLKELLF